jgi:TusA-related sulfurtransferase
MIALINRQLDLCGFHESVPVLQIQHAIDDLRNGEILLITTTDRNSLQDMDTWCTLTGNTLLQCSDEDGEFTLMIRKSRIVN